LLHTLGTFLTLHVGNHDLTLNPFHSGTTRERHLKARDLFTSIEAQAKGVYYLDTEVKFVTLRGNPDRQTRSITVPVYGNPHQPQFLKTDYSFTYNPYPSPESEFPWQSAPNISDQVPIWVMHGGPKGRLDKVNIPPLEGCAVQARKIYEARLYSACTGIFSSVMASSMWNTKRTRMK
jgi:hypothetical protein